MTELNKNSLHDEKFVIDFPIIFPIKIMGIDRPELHHLVNEVISKNVALENQMGISSNPSSKGKYIAITVKIMAQNQEQLDAIYIELSSSKYVAMAL